MNYYGKVFGAVLGWMLMRHPAGAVLGGLIGHAFDAGWFRGSGGGQGRDPESEARAVLGVAADASNDDIERAYRRKMADYHPDRVANAAQEIRDLAERRAREINLAYDTLMKRRPR